MNDDRPSPAKPVARSTLPRTPLIALVILVAVAIVGVLLARGRSQSPPPRATLIEKGPTAGANPPTVPKVPPVDLEFAAGKPTIPPPAVTALIKFAADARANPGTLRVSAQVENGPEMHRVEPLVKVRLAMLHHALRMNGIQGERISTEITRQNPGTMKAGDLDRIQLSLH